jgi:hypothetical protein
MALESLGGDVLLDVVLASLAPRNAAVLCCVSKALKSFVSQSAMWERWSEMEYPSLDLTPAKEIIAANYGPERPGRSYYHLFRNISQLETQLWEDVVKSEDFVLLFDMSMGSVSASTSHTNPILSTACNIHKVFKAVNRYSGMLKTTHPIPLTVDEAACSHFKTLLAQVLSHPTSSQPQEKETRLSSMFSFNVALLNKANGDLLFFQGKSTEIPDLVRASSDSAMFRMERNQRWNRSFVFETEGRMHYLEGMFFLALNDRFYDKPEVLNASKKIDLLVEIVLGRSS